MSAKHKLIYLIAKYKNQGIEVGLDIASRELNYGVVIPVIEAFTQCASDKHSAETEPKQEQEQEQEQSSQAWPAPTGLMRSVRVSSVQLSENASQLLKMA